MSAAGRSDERQASDEAACRAARPGDGAAAGEISAGHGALGILAGGGTLPVEIAAHATRVLRRPVHLIALEGEADPIGSDLSHTWVNWGQIGRMVATLRRHQCREIVLAGTVRRPNLWSLRPDFGLLLALPRLLRTLRGGDDSVLRRVIGYFESKGFTVVGLADVAPHLLAARGPLGAHLPSERDEAAIARGLALLETLGPFDVGQAVVATAERIVAIEGAGGTDAMLRGLAAQGGAGDGPRGAGAVLVKWPKPGQELRLDLPAAGPRTVEMAAKAGLAGIAVRAGAAVFLERDTLRRSADAAGLFVVGLEAPRKIDDIQPAAAAPATAPRSDDVPDDVPPAAAQVRMRTRRIPSPDERRDMAMGRRLLTALAPHGAGASAVIARQYVLAVEARETMLDVLARAGELRQWGRRGRRTVGTLVVREERAAPAWLVDAEQRQALIAGLAAARLAGLVVITPALTEEALGDFVARLDEKRLFFVTVEPGS